MVKNLCELHPEEYTHIDEALPDEGGVYDCIIRRGSISISYTKRQVLFSRGEFPRMDWDYVIMWKKKETDK